MEQQCCTCPSMISSISLSGHDHAKCIAQCLLACAAISALHRRFDTIREKYKIAQDLMYSENCLVAQAHSTAKVGLPLGDCQRAGLKTLFYCG